MNNNIKESPIIFSGPMVKAILEGRKTQTRLRIKGMEKWDAGDLRTRYAEFGGDLSRVTFFNYDKTPVTALYQPGDLLWVKETWAVVKSFDHLPPSSIPKGSANWPTVWYAVPEIAAASIKNTSAPVGKARPSIFMPRWASRLTLEVIGVGVERLQNISYLDCIAEGIQDWTFDIDGHQVKKTVHQLRSDYWRLWDSINGKHPGCSWDDNPWVWVVEFKRVETAGAARLPGM